RQEELIKELAEFKGILLKRTQFHAGYPYNLDYNYELLQEFFNFSINNLGDPFVDSNYGIDSKYFEKKVLSFFAKLYEIEESNYWGYVTTCGTEGNLYGLLVGREVYPDGTLYASQESHYSVFKAAKLYRMKSVMLPSLENGELNYDYFEAALEHESQPVILNLNVGTTMKGAIDNLDKVLDIFQRKGISQYYIHCDGALSGMMLPFMKTSSRISFQKPIDSISISGHKFIGCPMPSGIVMTRKEHVKKIESEIEYIGSKDTTIMGSRNGHAPLFLWHAIQMKGYEGFQADVEQCLENAQYLFSQLQKLNYSCMLNELSNTVVFKRPSEKIIKKWQLAAQGDLAHIVVMPNIDKAKIDRFITELVSPLTLLPKDFASWKSLEPTYDNAAECSEVLACI
ncbi:MAG TPA: histidine decarboxylase, partial [Candidatus Caenarcaniphilales bacterium]